MDDYDIFEGMLNELELLPTRSVALIADEVLDDKWFWRYLAGRPKLYEDIAIEMVNRYVDSGACEEWSANQWAFWFINGVLDKASAA